MQYEQKLVQPLMICTHAWYGRSRRAARSPLMAGPSSKKPAGPAGRLHGRLEQLGQAVEVLRPQGAVHEGEAREERRLLRLRQAAGHEHDAARVARA